MSNINQLIQEMFNIKDPNSWFDKKEPDEKATYVPDFIKTMVSKLKSKSNPELSPELKSVLKPECLMMKDGNFKCHDLGYDKENDK